MNNNFMEKADKQIKIERKLTDETRVGGRPWRLLKPFAMVDDYKLKDWFIALSAEERRLLEALRTAQDIQGDMDTLEKQVYNNEDLDADKDKEKRHFELNLDPEYWKQKFLY